MKLSTLNILALTLLSNLSMAQNSIQTGFFGGLNLNNAFNDIHLQSNHFGLTDPTGTCDKKSSFSSLNPGLQFGYLHPLASKMVLGIEGNFTYNLNQSQYLSCDCPYNGTVSDNYTFKNRSQGLLRARLGYLSKPQILPFLSVGASFIDTTMSYRNEGGNYYATNTSQFGWLLGAGLEWQIASSWSIRAEYDYVDYGSINMDMPNIYGLYDPNGSAHINLKNNTLRVALNYWF